MNLKSFASHILCREEFLIEVLRANSEMLLLHNIDIDNFIDNIYRFYDWDNDYNLMKQVYWLREEWDLATEGCISKEEAKETIHEFARMIVEKLAESKEDQRLQILKNGVKLCNPQHLILREIS